MEIILNAGSTCEHYVWNFPCTVYHINLLNNLTYIFSEYYCKTHNHQGYNHVGENV